MSSGFTHWFIASLIPLFLFAATRAGSGEDKTPSLYPSPTAVFDAYRKARDKRDARTVFAILTPQAQNDAVFESFFACIERQGADAITGRGSEVIARLVGRFLDTRTLNDDYEKQYKKKHGIDIAKVEEGHKNDPTFVPPPHDEQLWRDVVAAHVKDKAGFYEAVAKHFDERAAERHEENPISPLGGLEHLVVEGDTAKGSAKETILRRIASGESPPKAGGPPPIYEKPFKFRRINDGWLLDSL